MSKLSHDIGRSNRTSLFSQATLDRLIERIAGEPKKSARRGRWSRIEALEPRLVLSAPTIVGGLPDQLSLQPGTPIYIALDGFDPDGDSHFTYEVSNTMNGLTAQIPEGNDSVKITFEQEDSDTGAVTSYGDLIFELFEGRTPETTARIKQLAENGFYEGLTFHRIIDGFMIQGGDPNGTGSGGTGSKFPDEFHDDLQHVSAGVVSMANSGPDTNDSQFFITDAATDWLDGLHSVFGFVTQGESVRDTISNLPVDSNDRPLDTVYMRDVEVITDEENGLLMLTVDETAAGTGVITVTVTDENGESQDYEIAVAVVPEWDPVDPVDMDAGDESVQVTIPVLDYPGVTYDASPYYTSHPDFSVEIDPETGVIDITAPASVAGVQWIYITATTEDGSVEKYQYMPVYITPATPEIEFVHETDTGIVHDSVTAYNNSEEGAELQFKLTGVTAETEIALYVDGEYVETTIISSIDQGDGSNTFNTVIETVSGETLADGVHDFTVLQFISFEEAYNHDPVVSSLSNTIQVTIDTAAPVITTDDLTETIEQSLYVYNINSDDESSGNAIYTLGADAPDGMTIDESTGRIEWTPQAQDTGVNSVPVIVTDGAGNVTDHSFELTVIPNDFDIIVSGSNSTDEGGYITLNLSAIGQGIEGPVTFSLGQSDLPVDATFNINSTGENLASFTWLTTEADGPGSYTLTFVATDVDGSTQTSTVTVTVNEVNEAPSISDFTQIVVVEEFELAANLISATDPDRPSNDIVFELVGDVPSGATIDPSTGQFSWRPTESHGGNEFEISVRATDSAGASDTAQFTIYVVETDAAPIVSVPGNADVFEGETLRVDVNGYDPDNANDSLLFELIGDVPEGMTIDQSTGKIQWTVPNGYAGDQFTANLSVQIRVTEQAVDGLQGGALRSTEATLRIQVTNRMMAAMMSASNLKARSEAFSLFDEMFSPQRPIGMENAPVDPPQFNLSTGSGVVNDGPLFGLVSYGPIAGSGMTPAMIEAAFGQSDSEEGVNDPSGDEESGKLDDETPGSTSNNFSWPLAIDRAIQDVDNQPYEVVTYDSPQRSSEQSSARASDQYYTPVAAHAETTAQPKTDAEADAEPASENTEDAHADKTVSVNPSANDTAMNEAFG